MCHAELANPPIHTHTPPPSVPVRWCCAELNPPLPRCSCLASLCLSFSFRLRSLPQTSWIQPQHFAMSKGDSQVLPPRSRPARWHRACQAVPHRVPPPGCFGPTSTQFVAWPAHPHDRRPRPICARACLHVCECRRCVWYSTRATSCRWHSAIANTAVGIMSYRGCVLYRRLDGCDGRALGGFGVGAVLPFPA